MERIPTRDDLQRLLAWQPPDGVVSVYLDLRPEDRGQPWRTELRNGLAAVRDNVGRRDAALEATAQRIQARIEAEGEDPSGRSQIGFVDVATKPRGEQWFAVQAPLPESTIALAERPVLAPLAAMLDGNAPRGVAAVSAERVRLMRWSLGGIEEVDDWDLEVFSLDWRERKAQRSSDPSRFQGTSASGRDQHAQRMEHNRNRFLNESGRRAASELSQRGCAELLAFGEPDQVGTLTDGAGPELTVILVDARNLISAPVADIAARVQAYLADLQSERERQLAELVRAEVDRGERGVIGAPATGRALTQGRVEHLLLNPRADDGEDLVEGALRTDARVTALRSEAAAQTLAGTDGVAALLRY